MFPSTSTNSSPATQKKATDYTQNYNTLRSLYTRNNDINHETSSDEDDVQLFLNKSWDVYNVSPLYRLDYSDIHLKRCAKWMREQIVNFVSDIKKDQQYIVEFSVIKSLNTTNNDNDSLRVEIKSISVDKTSHLYEGIFLSMGQGNPNIHASFKYLPTLISRCSQTTATIVHGLLQRLFDCKICKIYFNAMDFKWLTALFCTDTNFSRVTTLVDLAYSVLDDKDSLHALIPLQSLADIWDSVKGDDSETVLLEEVREFHNLLNVIIKKAFQIDVERLSITKIKMSHFSVFYPCKIKVSDSKLLKEILLFQSDVTNIFSND